MLQIKISREITERAVAKTIALLVRAKYQHFYHQLT
jgi:hypothetical protein